MENERNLPPEITNFKSPKIMEHEEQKNLYDAKLVAWRAENKEIKDLKNEIAAIYFKKEFPDIKHAFVKEMKAVVCIDEGCAHKDYNGEGKLALAGSGILLPAQSEEERVQIAAKLFSEMGIKDITSHEGCGAVGLAYKRDFPDKKPTAQEIEQYGQDWTKKVAAEMGRMGHEANTDHIAAEEMERPVEFHNARAVYFDGIGGFNPNKEIGLPMGFVISRRFLPPEYAGQELQVAASIAFGHHGFGDLFTADEPLVIIPLAETDEQLADLKKEIEVALKDNKNYQDKKIKIDGVVVR